MVPIADGSSKYGAHVKFELLKVVDLIDSSFEFEFIFNKGLINLHTGATCFGLPCLKSTIAYSVLWDPKWDPDPILRKSVMLVQSWISGRLERGYKEEFSGLCWFKAGYPGYLQPNIRSTPSWKTEERV